MHRKTTSIMESSLLWFLANIGKAFLFNELPKFFLLVILPKILLEQRTARKKRHGD
jgi:hypothetical protein